MKSEVRVGIIGGSGLYQMEGLTDVQEMEIPTPFGNPSDSYRIGTLEGQRVVFLARIEDRLQRFFDVHFRRRQRLVLFANGIREQ